MVGKTPLLRTHPQKKPTQRITGETASSFSGNQLWCFLADAHFLRWSAGDVVGALCHYPLPCAVGVSLFFFMAVEYTHIMIPPAAPPYDLGFAATATLNRCFTARPNLNTFLAALNTVFVVTQAAYIMIWAWLIEGRPRATIAILFTFSSRGILGYATQLPLPQGFLGSGFDFPVGNVSFFLFYSGHVTGSVVASLDMKRMQRLKLSYIIDALNVLQVIRLLSTNGHYTIDLAVGFGAGIVFDSMAAKYENLENIVQ